MRVAIISGGKLPVPAVKGGAVETGIQQLVNENEINNKIDLTVYSIYDEEAVIESKKYKNTRFIFIKDNKYYDILARIINKICIKLKITYRCEPQKKYINKINRDLGKKDFDKVLIKNKVNFVLNLNKVSKEKKYLQIHNDFLNKYTFRSAKIYNNTNKIITNSEYIKRQVLTIPGSDENKILLNKNCTDTDIFDKRLYINQKEDIRRKYKIQNDDIVIMYSGRIVEQKGIKELILACKEIKDDKKYKLLIVGSSWFGKTSDNKYLKELKELSEAIKDKIIFTGYIEYNELPKIHSIVDIAVVPSIWEEPAGRVVLEAQSSGIPVIVSDAGGIPEYVCDDSAIIVSRDNDFINNLSNSIELLIENDELRNKMAKYGRDYAQGFSSNKYYEELIDLFKIR